MTDQERFNLDLDSLVMALGKLDPREVFVEDLCAGCGELPECCDCDGGPQMGRISFDDAYEFCECGRRQQECATADGEEEHRDR